MARSTISPKVIGYIDSDPNDPFYTKHDEIREAVIEMRSKLLETSPDLKMIQTTTIQLC